MTLLPQDIRHTVATLVEQAAGIAPARPHERTDHPRHGYVVSAEQIDPITVDILDAVLGS